MDGRSRAHVPADPVEWAREHWRRRRLGPGEDAFVAMATMLRYQRLVTLAIEDELKRHGLNLNDYLLLMALELSADGTRSVSELARGRLIHPTTASLVIDRLATRGWLSRSPHPTDRRATLVTISTEGRARAREASRGLAKHEYGLVGTAAVDHSELIELLTRLRSGAGG